MSTPTTQEEYVERYTANQRVSGYGAEVTQHAPCPFCAAADFMTARIMDFEEVASKEHVCAECGRGARLVFTRSGGSVGFEMVQTRGDAPPAWAPAMRRVDPEEAPKP